MMRFVYPDSAIHLFSPLVGLADEGFDLDPALRPLVINEDTVKPIYKQLVYPYFFSLEEKIQNALKLSLQYILNLNEYNYRSEFLALLPPFDCPADNPRNIFLWLWHSLFPNEFPSSIVEKTEEAFPENIIRHILEN